ncbi:MAG: ABC transporter ATP-binding protein/permease [Lachnospiraceae bacterium]|nr:ABC transporter ATP-binding protein/permease [Lachnospiraceae bacterium]
MIKTILSNVKQYTFPSLITPVFMIGEVIMEMLIPIMMANIIDKGISAGSISSVVSYGLGMIAMGALGLFFGVMGAVCGARASTGLACNLRDAMYLNIQKFSFSNIDKFSTAGLVTRMTTDVTNVQVAYQMILRISFRAPVTLITALFMSFSISSRLASIFLVAVLVLAVVLVIIMSTTMGLFQKGMRMYDDLNEEVEEDVTAIRTVKAFVRENYVIEAFRNAADNIRDVFVKAEIRMAFNGPVMMICVYGSMLTLSWMGANMIISDELTTGQLTSLFSYVMSILMSLMMLSMIFVMLTMSMASGRRIAEVINEKPSMKDPETPVTEVKDGSVDFCDVSFSYRKGSGNNVLSDVNFHVNSGETIGIIGPTGSSKSSLVSLISRLYDVTEGKVMVGGVDVRDYSMEALRSKVSVVLQNNVLFSGSIYENLRWGNPDATDEECREACRIACADEFVERMPEGYDSIIEQGGTNVSGGQRQRLCIARALVGKPAILILDDSTSAVDTATDSRIRKAFKERIPGTTKFIIAQRITSVMDSDRIIVLDDGRVAEFGTHDELMERSEAYREIYESQTSGSGDFDEFG